MVVSFALERHFNRSLCYLPHFACMQLPSFGVVCLSRLPTGGVYVLFGWFLHF